MLSSLLTKILRTYICMFLFLTFSFDMITLDGTQMEGNKKGDVLLIQKLEDSLYESGDSDCFSP